MVSPPFIRAILDAMASGFALMTLHASHCQASLASTTEYVGLETALVRELINKLANYGANSKPLSKSYSQTNRVRTTGLPMTALTAHVASNRLRRLIAVLGSMAFLAAIVAPQVAGIESPGCLRCRREQIVIANGPIVWVVCKYIFRKVIMRET